MPKVSYPVRLTELSPIASGSTTSPSDTTDTQLRLSSHPKNPTIDTPLQGKSDQVIQIPEANSGPHPSLTRIPSQPQTKEGLGTVIDPISRQILERTKSHLNGPRMLPLNSTQTSLGSSQESHAASYAPDVSAPATLRRSNSVGSVNKGMKDKKKGVSLFSRFIGTKKKDTPGSLPVEVTSPSGRVPTDAETEVFSRSVGFIPQFPAPPRYIKVRANNRKQKEFERVFLAQVLLGRNQRTRRKPSGDEEIVLVGEGPVGQAQPLSRAIWAMEFSKDGRYLAAAGQDKKVRVWAVISSTEDRETHEAEEEEKSHDQPGIRLNAPVLKTKPLREYQGHTSSVLDLSWSKNNFLLSSSMDKTVRLWHISRGECLCAFKHHDFVTSIAFHPRDDRFFLAGSLDSKLRLWSIPDKAVAYWVNVPDMVTAVAFTPDGKTCIAGCLNGLCLFYDTEKLKIHSQLHVRSARGRNAKGSKITGIDTIMLPPADPNGDVKLLITSNDSRVRMYNYKDRNLEIKFRGNENTCSQIHATFSDDGRQVICGSEDKKVYIWPTGPTEKQDQDKRPVEILEAHTAIVTSAILAPTKARQHLAQSADPIYDLCNPPPVTLMSNDSILSSHAQTESGRSAREQAPSSLPGSRNGSARAEEIPAYLARHAHPGGNIIVTADYLGQIKIFRQDCAFQKRRYESFDSASMFSRNRLLGRSGSVTTRTSVSSARNSMGYSSSKSRSMDRIIHWRNSITNGTIGNPASTISSDIHANLHRARSDSPRKSGAQVSSPQPLAAEAAPITTMSPATSDPNLSNEITGIAGPGPGNTLTSATRESDDYLRDRSPTIGPERALNPMASDPEDALKLRGDHSYRYWNQDKFAVMAQHEPRAPGFLSPGEVNRNPLSREPSFSSRLSSELGSDKRATSDADEDRRDEVKCPICGGRSFRLRVGQGKTLQERRPTCKRCGNVV